jgi:hypothetical protein
LVKPFPETGAAFFLVYPGYPLKTSGTMFWNIAVKEGLM